MGVVARRWLAAAGFAAVVAACSDDSEVTVGVGGDAAGRGDTAGNGAAAGGSAQGGVGGRGVGGDRAGAPTGGVAESEGGAAVVAGASGDNVTEGGTGGVPPAVGGAGAGLGGGPSGGDAGGAGGAGSVPGFRWAKNVWLLGGVQRLVGPLVYDDGSVVVSGMFTDQLRLGEPGTVIATEQTRGSDFLLRFSKDSRLDWVKVFPVSGHLANSIARTPSDGVLAAALPDLSRDSELSLVAWHGDGTPAWTSGLGCSTPPLIVSNGAWFVLKTDGLGACDLEPGAGSAPANGAPYWVAYHF